MGLLEKRLKGNGGRFSEKAEELRERRGVFLRILEKPQKFQAVGFQLCENTASLRLIAVVSISATDDETAVVSISFFHHRKNKKGRKPVQVLSRLFSFKSPCMGQSRMLSSRPYHFGGPIMGLFLRPDIRFG